MGTTQSNTTDALSPNKTHTPGPWRCDRKHEDCNVWYVDAADQEVAVVYSHTNQLANARLLAAAPELLHALWGMVGLIQLVESRHDFPPDLTMRRNHRYVDACELLARIADARVVLET